MRRSSCTSCMPARAIAWLFLPAISTPSSTTEPARGVTTPIRLFSVVLLPAPLRPSSATTSFRSTRSDDVEEDVRVAVVAVQAVDLEQAHSAASTPCTPPR